jgi:DNA repair exonuclease SbcCD nuclease subunit
LRFRTRRALMQFLHTSDWQLGKPFGRAPAQARAALREARLDAIDTLAAAARREGAEIVLVAGDMFDSAEPGDRVYRQALTRMKAAADIRWVLLPGNHDPARADGLWSRLIGEAPATVTVCLEPQPLALAEGFWLLPAPLQFKRSLDDPTGWFDHAETPVGAKRIGLAHGAIRDFGSGGAATNLIAPDRAHRSGLTYLALGDWHSRREIDPHTYYSGTPEPDDFGREVSGVALHVDLRGDNPRVADVPIGRYHWTAADWSLRDAATLNGLLASLAPAVERANLVARLKLSGLLSLAECVSVRDRLENELAHEVRWLDLNLDDLYARPTDTDLSDIGAHGVLRVAAERLQALSAEGGVRGKRAAAALERLYVEERRADRAEAR